MNWLIGIIFIIGGAIVLGIGIIWIRSDQTETEDEHDDSYPSFYKARLMSVFVIMGIMLLIMGILFLAGVF